MRANIVSISIYCKGQRVKLSPDSGGKFLIPNFSTADGRVPLIRVTAKQLIYNLKIKYMDPVLTLDDGSKLRVFQGGDPTGLLTRPISLIEKHDKKHAQKNKALSKGRLIGSSYHDGYPGILDWDWPDTDWD